MDEPIRHTSSRKVRSDIKVNEISKYSSKIPPQPPLTKKRFEALLTKAAQPLKPDSKVKETLAVRPSDGCTETHTNQDKTEDKEDLPSD